MKKLLAKTNIIAALVFLAGSLISVLIVLDVYSSQYRQMHALVQSVANSRLNLFLEALDERTAVSDTLEALVFDVDGERNDLKNSAEEIYRDTHPMISWFALAPQGKVTYVYPEEESSYVGQNLFTSKDAVGLDYASMSQRNLISRSEDGKLVIYNPVYLRQEKTGYQEFWGFVIVCGPIDSILKNGRISDLNQNGYLYSLQVESSYNHKTAVISSNHEFSEKENPEVFKCEEPGYSYTLSLIPKRGWVDQGTIIMTGILCGILTILITILTVSLQHQRRTNSILAEISARDRLTGLPNSRSFDTETKLLEKEKQGYTLFFLDANYFKHVNDTYGHEAGNEVLCEYGIRLQEVFPNQVYRLGGDEFAALVVRPLSEKEAQEYVEKTREALREPYVYNQNRIMLSMSVGWALSSDQEKGNDILNRADQMMYQNKQEYHQKMQAER